jgi:hypothetical protein
LAASTTGLVRPRGDDLSDASGAHDVVAEELEAVFQPLGQRGQIGRGVLMEEVDSKSRGQLAFLVQCEERRVHRVVVFVRRAVVGVLVPWNAP